jgi:hypothetical protein
MSADVVALRPDHEGCLDLDDTGRLRRKLHLLNLSLDGLIKSGNVIETHDVETLWWLVFEMQEILPPREADPASDAGDGGGPGGAA